MFLNRAGRFLLLLSIGAFILRHMGMSVAPSRIVLMGAGTGLGLIMLGAMFGGSAAPRRRSSGAKYPPAVPSQSPAYRVDPVHVVGQPVARVRLTCQNCKNPLRGGARFCTRCGVAVAQSAPAIFAPAPAPPGPAAASRPAVAPGPKKRFPVVRIALFLGLCFYGYGVYTDWQQTGRLPWDGWQLPSELSEAISGSTTDSESQPLPVAPEPGKLSSAPGTYIDHAWVVPGAINDQGYLGLGVHAVINAWGSQGERFVAHFRYDDSAPVYAVGPQYADPNGHAATAVRVPDGPRPVEVTAFIPYSAISLRSSGVTLQLLPSLYDSDGRQLGACQPVPFTVYRGSIYITRVRVSSNVQSSLYRGPHPKLLVSFRSSESRALAGDVVVRFKDERGMTIPGQYQYASPGGELKLRTGFHLSSNRGDVTMDDLPVEIPPGVVPARATAEISLYDSLSGAALTPPVMFKMP